MCCSAGEKACRRIKGIRSTSIPLVTLVNIICTFWHPNTDTRLEGKQQRERWVTQSSMMLVTAYDEMSLPLWAIFLGNTEGCHTRAHCISTLLLGYDPPITFSAFLSLPQLSLLRTCWTVCLYVTWFEQAETAACRHNEECGPDSLQAQSRTHVSSAVP